MKHNLEAINASIKLGDVVLPPNGSKITLRPDAVVAPRVYQSVTILRGRREASGLYFFGFFDKWSRP